MEIKNVNKMKLNSSVMYNFSWIFVKYLNRIENWITYSTTDEKIVIEHI